MRRRAAKGVVDAISETTFGLACGQRIYLIASDGLLIMFPLTSHGRGWVMAYELRGLFDRAVAILQGNPGQSIKAVSQALRVERHTLQRAFWLSAGKSFRQFRRDAVLAKAKVMLASQPNVPVKEIAFLLGYSSDLARQSHRKTRLTAAASSAGVWARRAVHFPGSERG